VPGLFRVTLSEAASQSVLVSYTVSGSALAGTDYTALPGQLTIAPGAVSGDITLEPVDDNAVEDDETVIIRLVSASGGYTLRIPTRAQMLILDNDTESPNPDLPQVSLSAAGNAAEDGLVDGAFRMTLDQPAPAAGLTVLYGVGGSATAGADYQALPGTVNFGAGETAATITVTPLSDNETEGDETVQLTLLIDESYIVNSAASRATILITDRPIPDNPLSDLPGLTPNEQEVAGTIENLCRDRAATNNFLRDCDALIGSALSGDPNAIAAISQITPDAVSTAVDASETSVQAQLLNIRTRLFSLRRGRTGIDLDGLNFDYDAWVFSGKYLRMLDEQGGAAGDDNTRSQREPSRFGIFISGNVDLGKRDETENQDGFDFNTYGLTAGLDYRFTERLVLGGALTYSTGDTDINANGGKLSSDGYALTLYGTYSVSDRLYIEGSISYGRYNYDQERNLRYQLGSNATSIDQTFDAGYDGTQYAIDLSSGYDLTWNEVLFGPRIRISYVQAEIDGFSERARNDNPGSAWAVTVEDQKQRSLTVSLGGQASYVIRQSWGALTPEIEAEWIQELLNDDLVVNGRFIEGANVPDNNFQLVTDELDSSYFSLGAGVSARWENGASAFIRYRTVFAYENLTEHAISTGFRWEF
jgi:outer membrane autotransporter protein